MMRTKLLGLLLLNGCVLLESPGGLPEHNCGKPRATADNGRCSCNDDCENVGEEAVCLSEYRFGWAGGMCYHACKDDTECSDGRICQGEICYQACATSSDCDPGRMCREGRDKRRPVCMAVCDENADCDSQACNVYSNLCLLAGEQVTGAGLNAPCTTDDECQSDQCSNGVCVTLCDMSAPKCPEGGVCVSGWCENACTAPENCALNQSCVETDAGKVCSSQTPREAAPPPSGAAPVLL